MSKVHKHWSACEVARSMAHPSSIAGSCLEQSLHLAVDIAHPLQGVTRQRIHLQAAVSSVRLGPIGHVTSRGNAAINSRHKVGHLAAGSSEHWHVGSDMLRFESHWRCANQMTGTRVGRAPADGGMVH